MTEKEYLKIIDTVVEAANAYYNEDDPIMDDYDYDMLMQQVKTFEKENPNKISPKSLTQMVGGNTGKSTFKKVEHKIPMLSLEDIFNIEDIISFVNKFQYGTRFSVEEKIDGLSMSVTYKDGILVRAETRGDGYIGEDITENAKIVIGIPEKLNELKGNKYIDELEVRCEVYLPIDEFNKINEEKLLNNEKPFKNPRNAAAGLLRTKDIAKIKNCGLRAFVFNLQRYTTKDGQGMDYFSSHTNSLETLRKMGFEIVKYYPAASSDEVRVLIERIGKSRNSNPYWIDGAVVKIDDLKTRRSLGATVKYPLWAKAFKYPPEQKETIITDIVLQTGRTGVITPVAVFKPVYLAGTKVERAQLHNQEIINRLGVNIGDTVLVQKAAEIIPKIIKVSKKGCLESPYDLSSHICPSCGQKLTINTSGVAICSNIYCLARISNKFVFWGSRDCMDIKGFGPSVVDKLIDARLLTEIPDIYRLASHRTILEDIEGFSKKSVDNLLNAIDESKNRDIDRLIKALGIFGVGRHVGKILAQKYPDIFAIGSLSDSKQTNEEKMKEYTDIEGVGYITAQAILDWFSDVQNLQMLFSLEILGVNMKSKSYNTNDNVKQNHLTFVITGTLPTLKRSEAQKLIEDNGCKVSSSISKNTSYLVAGENAGSKLEKAKFLGVKIISEEELIKLLSQFI